MNGRDGRGPGDSELRGGVILTRKGSEPWQKRGILTGVLCNYMVPLKDGTHYDIRVEKETFWTIQQGTHSDYVTIVGLPSSFGQNMVKVNTDQHLVINLPNILIKVGLPLLALVAGIVVVLLQGALKKRKQAERAALQSKRVADTIAQSILTKTKIPARRPSHRKLQHRRVAGRGRHGIRLQGGGLRGNLCPQSPALGRPAGSGLRLPLRTGNRHLRGPPAQQYHPHLRRRILRQGGRPAIPYMVMELLEGQSLDQIVKGRIERREVPDMVFAVRVASAIAQALGVAHQHGIVHRDIKPGNVFLTTTGSSKCWTSESPAHERGHPDRHELRPSARPPTWLPSRSNRAATSTTGRTVFLGVVLYGLITYQLPYDDEDPALLIM